MASPGHIDVALRNGKKGRTQVKDKGRPEPTLGHIIAKAGLDLEEIREHVEKELGTTPP